MRLRIITATRGDSPFWGETVSSVNVAAYGSQHVVVGPLAQLDKIGIVPTLQCIAEQKQGLYPKLNQALDVEGDWDAFTWINDDDVLRAPGFMCGVQRLQSSAKIDIVYGNVAIIDGQSQDLGRLPVAKRVADLSSLFVAGIIPFAQPGTVIRREIWERLGGLDESYRIVGDMDFFIRALAAGARFEYVDTLVAAFRLRAGQLSKSRLEVVAETRRALALLGTVRAHSLARLRFRIHNIPTYTQRLKRFGWVSMRQIYDRTT